MPLLSILSIFQPLHWEYLLSWEHIISFSQSPHLSGWFFWWEMSSRSKRSVRGWYSDRICIPASCDGTSRTAAASSGQEASATCRNWRFFFGWWRKTGAIVLTFPTEKFRWNPLYFLCRWIPFKLRFFLFFGFGWIGSSFLMTSKEIEKSREKLKASWIDVWLPPKTSLDHKPR